MILGVSIKTIGKYFGIGLAANYVNAIIFRLNIPIRKTIVKWTDIDYLTIVHEINLPTISTAIEIPIVHRILCGHGNTTIKPLHLNDQDAGAQESSVTETAIQIGTIIGQGLILFAFGHAINSFNSRINDAVMKPWAYAVQNYLYGKDIYKSNNVLYNWCTHIAKTVPSTSLLTSELKIAELALYHTKYIAEHIANSSTTMLALAGQDASPSEIFSDLAITYNN